MAEIYITSCPYCGGGLDVVGFSFEGSIPLRAGGFSTEEAKVFNTKREQARCRICGLVLNGLPIGRGWHVLAIAYYETRSGARRQPFIDIYAAPVLEPVSDNKVDDWSDALKTVRHYFPWASEPACLLQLADQLASKQALVIGALSWYVKDATDKDVYR